jgi:hypothetical protein
MDWLDNSVGRCRQKSIDLMRPRHRLGFGPSVAVERRPDAGEGRERPVVVQCEPDSSLATAIASVRPLVSLQHFAANIGDTSAVSYS